MTDPRRALPSVNALLESDLMRPLAANAPRAALVDAVRMAIDAARQDPEGAPQTEDDWARAVTAALSARQRPSLRPVLNATGVVLHTNLGRAPLSASAIAAMGGTALGYSNLEYDLERGTRGSRYVHCVDLLRELTGAEDAIVVNNGAAALLLALNTFAEGRDAIVSRGELVEIGGSFRIPDIMAKSGARLVEVGTTNRTHAEDYLHALAAGTGAIVKVHRSNFSMDGFVADVPAAVLARLGEEHGVPVLHDLGSGLFLSLEAAGLTGEPDAARAVRDGATVVTMSGDKLLGGPQAGIALGRREAVARMRTNPLTRALRVDKLTLCALEATLAHYRDPARARREIPVLAMLSASPDSIRLRAERLRDRLAAGGVSGTVVESESSVGGGAFPSARIASWAVALTGEPAVVEVRLRRGAPPIVGRIVDGRVRLDLRSVPENDDDLLAAALLHALA